MTRRGDLISMAALGISLVLVALAVAFSFVGNYGLATALCGIACYLMLLVVYLEVYSRRG